MARLILSLDGQVLAEYNMSKERYTIGRLPDNDVRIDNPAVSGHHSLIINILNDSFLEDLNSTNGTYVNGRLIKKHALQHGDTITIGHHQLRFVDQQSDSAQDEFEKTMVIHPSTQSKRSLDRVQQAVEEASAAASPPPPPPPITHLWGLVLHCQAFSLPGWSAWAKYRDPAGASSASRLTSAVRTASRASATAAMGTLQEYRKLGVQPDTSAAFFAHKLSAFQRWKSPRIGTGLGVGRKNASSTRHRARRTYDVSPAMGRPW